MSIIYRHGAFVLYLAATWFFRLLASLSKCCQLACAALYCEGCRLETGLQPLIAPVAGAVFQPGSPEVRGSWSNGTLLSFSSMQEPLLFT